MPLSPPSPSRSALECATTSDEDARPGKTFHRTKRVRQKSRRHALLLAYDGSGFSGFQRQPDRRTVEGTLIEVLAALDMPTGLSYAGRTDAGVHALGQVVVLRIPLERDIDDVVRDVSARLPPDMRIRSHVLAPKTFHPRWSATSKRYRYWLSLPGGVATDDGVSIDDGVSTGGEVATGDDSMDGGADGEAKSVRHTPSLRFELRRLAEAGIAGLEPWVVGAPFDRDRFRHAVEDLRHAADLRGFTAHGAPFRNMPPLQRLCCEFEGGLVKLSFDGPGFARYAVRHMVGCAVAVARGELPDDACSTTALADVPYRGLRAPAQALVLESVGYADGLDPFTRSPASS